VYDDHSDAVYAFFAASVSSATAEDLASGAWERIVKGWGSYDERKGSERTWILTIARNLLTDYFRRQQHRETVSTDEHPGLVDSLVEESDLSERTLTNDELRSWLDLLKPRDREVLVLRYIADLSAPEVGELLDLSVANVHQIISRSLRRLRETAETPQGQRLTRRSTSR
jgi:RNA polymerase sigma-70 factor (ECF subfamily)